MKNLILILTLILASSGCTHKNKDSEKKEAQAQEPSQKEDTQPTYFECGAGWTSLEDE